MTDSQPQSQAILSDPYLQAILGHIAWYGLMVIFKVGLIKYVY